MDDTHIIRKILHSLHNPKYNIVTSLLYEKGIDMLNVVDVVGKIWSHEVFLMGDIEPPQTKKDLALKAKNDHKSKKRNKCKTPPSSSSNDEASDDSNEDDGNGDEELALLMRKTTKMMSRLNKKRYNYDPKKNKFQLWLRRSATIMANIVIIFPMIVPRHQDSSRSKKMMKLLKLP